MVENFIHNNVKSDHLLVDETRVLINGEYLGC